MSSPTGLRWPDVLGPLIAGESLPAASTRWAMAEIMDGSATPSQVAAFAALLHAKGETPEELGGLAEEMRGRAPRVALPGPAVDIVGTGGDRAETVNISSMAAIVVAGTGRTVAKHGNRSASSKSGSTDVLEELGIAVDLDASGVEASLARVGIGFCAANVFHAGMRHAAVPRREMGVPTAFNLLGPLTNPARPGASSVGCFDLAMAPVVAGAFAARGDTAIVARGDDGLDEFTTTTTTHAWVVSGGEVHPVVVDATRLGIAAVPPVALRGGDRIHNAGVVRAVVAGELPEITDAVTLNAAAAIVAHDLSTGVVTLDARDPGASTEALLADALVVARAAVADGRAADLLARWQAFRP
ncbi:anthranilate phosphoribosyltransferase [Jatrophihabitans sp. YIM 134969]